MLTNNPCPMPQAQDPLRPMLQYLIERGTDDQQVARRGDDLDHMQVAVIPDFNAEFEFGNRHRAGSSAVTSKPHISPPHTH